jgi:hypothetical protein
MKNISYQNDELLKKLFKRITPESPSVGFAERVMDFIIQPEVDMSVHQQTVNKLLWTLIATVALIIPVLFFLLDWSLLDLLPKSISADTFNRFIVFLSNLPEYFNSLLAGLKQYSLLFIILAAGIALIFIDSMLNKSLIRNIFPFHLAGNDTK